LENPVLSRRRFIQGCGLSIAGAGLLASPLAQAASLATPRVQYIDEARDLVLYNQNTREQISTVFYAHGQYNRQSFNQLCHFLRDHHENATHWMDPRLLTVLHDIQSVFDKRQIEVISGYRTARTNAMLRREHINAAKDSYHVKGQAIDIRIHGVETNAIRDVTKILAAGGVGYYPWAHFVHVDTGPIRYW
jgi:uncharacterized protein YcbK (DUF882 family)